MNDKLQKCQQVGEAANVAMREMKQEYQSLSEQDRLLRTDAVTPYAVMRKKVSHDAVVTYVLAGVGFLSGIAQILLGVGLDWTGAGAIPGTLLLINGINNVYENGYTLLFGKNTIGPGRMMYRSAASTLGYSHSAADMALGGVDLLLSGYGLLKLSLKPEAWRLFRYINTDYIRGWRNMGRTSLMLEGGADVSTLNSIIKAARNSDGTNFILYSFYSRCRGLSGREIRLQAASGFQRLCRSGYDMFFNPLLAIYPFCQRQRDVYC